VTVLAEGVSSNPVLCPSYVFTSRNWKPPAAGTLLLHFLIPQTYDVIHMDIIREVTLWLDSKEWM